MPSLDNPKRAAQADAPLSSVARKLVLMEARLVGLEKQMRRAIDRTPSDRRDSARNLVHYIALRKQDLREVQSQLSQRGLSSLGRSESCVMESLLQVSERAHEALVLQGDKSAAHELSRLAQRRSATLSWEQASDRLHAHTREILGPRPEGRHIYIMVTAPSAKEADRAWMTKMLAAGMNVLRINCAHEGEQEWALTIQALKDARRATGRECRVVMDLAGPKIRTGAIGGGRSIATWKPTRDDLGTIVTPARVLIGNASVPREPGSGVALLVNENTFRRILDGDELRFRDARKKKRVLAVDKTDADIFVARSDKRAYVVDRTRARLYRGSKAIGSVTLEVARADDASIDVKVGDTLVLTSRNCQGQQSRRDASGRVEHPGVIACTLPAALRHLAVGHRVLFDDGRIQAVVERSTKRGQDHLLRIVRTTKETVKLRPEKGINLPDTLVAVPSLTAEDRRALRFVAQHADAVSLSFVRRPADLRSLHAALDRLGSRSLGVILKIETRAGFESLPGLLLEGLRRPPLAVMIARGDLAVEVGFERLAELQEEILWLCESAHVPTIWATQVLDTLARTGVPSRAEVTDAAAGVAAECVMLNKGPFVDEAVRALSDILSRMEQHRYKKRNLYRKLRVSTFRAANREHQAQIAAA